ncbi:MAG: glycosyltransferase family 1 protein, partial [marine benthic group bacterium]|nr:glycosyltransferase family 1 protein [Gemmatimonadota bacterium]
VALVTPRIGQGPAAGTRLHMQLPSFSVPIYPQLQLARPMGPLGSRQLRAFDPDVVHVATEFTVGWSGVRWALDQGVSLLTSFHTDFPAYLAGYGLGRLKGPAWRYLRLFHERSVHTFCPSRATLRQLRDNGFGHRLSVWSRGVDGDRFHPAHRNVAIRRQLSGEAEKLLVYVGRLAPEKRVDVLLEAFRILRSDLGPHVALAVIGDGPARADLERTAPRGVTFTGFLQGDDLAAAYASGDIFTFPSDTETFGNVVLEAMASGLPVIAPSRGGVTDFVRHGENGMLVEPREPAEFACAARRLLQDAAARSRMARQARTAAEGRSWYRVFDGLFSAYEDSALTHPPEAASLAA